jgi:acyl-CoA reductase-like NAD-dependent aldehyde dehydrogenase
MINFYGQPSTVILELGGKNPTWVDESTDMASTAKRLMYGKVGLNTFRIRFCQFANGGGEITY